MGVCPLCNGLSAVQTECPSCGVPMEDSGKMMDFFDDYSPYMPIEQMKLENGYPFDAQREECLHYLACPVCGFYQLQAIKEW